MLKRSVPVFASAVRSAGARTVSRAVAPCAARCFSTTYPRAAIKYAKSHEWAKLEGDIATIGISDHAQQELGDIVYVDLPEAGDAMTAGKTIAAVESVKAAADVYSPVTGEVIESNDALGDEPALINSSATDKGWIAKVKVTNPAELEAMMDQAAYDKFCEEAAH